MDNKIKIEVLASSYFSKEKSNFINYLTKNVQYNVSVTIKEPEDFFETVKETKYDFILLDILNNSRDNLKIISNIRKANIYTPAILYTSVPICIIKTSTENKNFITILNPNDSDDFVYDKLDMACFIVNEGAARINETCNSILKYNAVLP